MRRRIFLLLSVFVAGLWLASCRETSMGDFSDGRTVTSAETTAAPPGSGTDRSSVTDSVTTAPHEETATERSLPTDCEPATMSEDGTQEQTVTLTKAASDRPDGCIKVGQQGGYVKLPWDFQQLAEAPGTVRPRAYMRRLPGGETVSFTFASWPLYFREHDDSVPPGEIADSLTEVQIALESDSWEDAQADPFFLNDARRSDITVNGLPFVHQTGTLSRDQDTQ